ncbi:hypothetical protein HMPREF9997_01821 [Corynebacterium durum F0235]|uniref:Uncharacterized protein n=1 Tax=Corynebacterium durum F0235 TaxID=1035195 RepID=L1ME93_9CORY|nr:hypothetical protein HMPREF9997_01821 [Corynebacterium durum F0235]
MTFLTRGPAQLPLGLVGYTCAEVCARQGAEHHRKSNARAAQDFV